jgi:MoaA/NifB/PqqE/SkfB family radical SAM enzyme
MIATISLCPVCYKKIPAFVTCKNNEAWMEKECDVHGKFESLVEKSFKHFSNFYQKGTMGNNNHIIIHITDKCNMKCPWCYYPTGNDDGKPLQFFDQLLRDAYPGYGLMLSGGEPTVRKDYIEFATLAYFAGWKPSTITNMIKLADDTFFQQTLNEVFISGKNDYRFALSFQHPKNYSKGIYEQKRQALENIKKFGLKASCVVFSIQSLDELGYIKEFYDETKELYTMLRIRTMFHNWKNKGEKTIFLSELHAAFLDKFADYCPIQSRRIEQSNIYCLYMETKEAKAISISSAPTVDNVDYHLTSRPVFMLANDLRCYPVPLTQIVNEGFSLGWKDGYKIIKE